MRVYRVETADGLGAFEAGLAHDHDDCVRSGRVKAYDMPTLREEPDHLPLHKATRGSIYGLPFSHRFGFRSVTQYRRAFRSKPGRKAMGRAGGQLSVYEVPRDAVLLGASQLTFDRRRAKLVAVLHCETLEPIREV